MNLLSPKIIIETNPDFFIFTSSTSTIRLDTCLYTTMKDGAPDRIVSVGEEANNIPNAVKINLFKPDASPMPYDKLGALGAFLLYGISKSDPRPSLLAIFVHRIVIFRGIQALDSILASYQRGILERLAKEALAGSVVFE